MMRTLRGPMMILCVLALPLVPIAANDSGRPAAAEDGAAFGAGPVNPAVRRLQAENAQLRAALAARNREIAELRAALAAVHDELAALRSPLDPAEYEARRAKAIDQYLKANKVPERVAQGLREGRPVPGMSLKQFEMIGGSELLLETEHARVLRVWVHSPGSREPTFYVVRLSLKDDVFESVTLSR